MINSFNSLLKKYPLVFVDVGTSGGFHKKIVSKIKNIYKVGFEPHVGSFEELKLSRKDDELIINKTS